MEIPVPGISVTLTDEVLLICSERPLKVISSGLTGGGIHLARYFLNVHVHKDYDGANPAAELKTIARQYGIRENFVGMMTAAYLSKARSAILEHQNHLLWGVMTVGLSNATSAGISPPAFTRPGTINTILIVDADLSPAALVNAVGTATEAKCDALRQAGARTCAGDFATGTSTDSIAIACTGRGGTLAYAGPATHVGWLIARAVRQIIGEILA